MQFSIFFVLDKKVTNALKNAGFFFVITYEATEKNKKKIT